MAVVERDIHYRITKEIEKYPLLYNYNLPEYSNKMLNQKAWDEIAMTLNRTVHDCKEKWRNIRSSFIRSQKSQKATSGYEWKHNVWKPKKRYYLADDLAFILPYLKPQLGLGPDTEYAPGSEDDVSQELEEANESTQAKNEAGDTSDDENDEVYDANVEGPTPRIFAEPIAASHHSNRARKRLITEVDKTYIECMTDKQSRNETAETTATHPMQYFFLSLLGEFDTMTESQMRQFKIRVLQTIDEIKANRGPVVSSPIRVSNSPEPSQSSAIKSEK
ncbi:uncharacterized protein LOC126371519 [Pectinophora gossypiella]|uniref:MADF domain-containing protein n=1 Tax=Pectinophora gossypiella TaxID=13191 RepID=A0A1E1VYK4_PECGO|nr:uncharacterized protein LOC126371519 [Pectinophora gossypiella]